MYKHVCWMTLKLNNNTSRTDREEKLVLKVQAGHLKSLVLCLLDGN